MISLLYCVAVVHLPFQMEGLGFVTRVLWTGHTLQEEKLLSTVITMFGNMFPCSCKKEKGLGQRPAAAG